VIVTIAHNLHFYNSIPLEYMSYTILNTTETTFSMQHNCHWSVNGHLQNLYLSCVH